MRTINEICETYKTIFEGKKVLINGFSFSTDGINWLVDNEPIDTLENKKEEFLKLNDKIKILKNCAKQIGINTKQIESYYLKHDDIDDMILLVYNEKDILNIIYLKSLYAVFEQIDKQSGMMDYNLFNIENSEILITTHRYKLSLKSLKLIEGLNELKEFKFSQNQFYDILPENFNDFSELISPDLSC